MPAKAGLQAHDLREREPDDKVISYMPPSLLISGVSRSSGRAFFFENSGQQKHQDRWPGESWAKEVSGESLAGLRQDALLGDGCCFDSCRCPGSTSLSSSFSSAHLSSLTVCLTSKLRRRDRAGGTCLSC